MTIIEAGENPIPSLRIGKIVTFAQFSQMGMALNSESMSLITPIRHLQHEVIVLPSFVVMNQLPGSE
ncbi:MAG TPA: hypothetical protein DFK12_09370 [Gallionellaceae bacterium]|nr:hypothetical protein [Gallionellaceae bacterium]